MFVRGAAAMQALGVERSRDKELHAIGETGEGHAAGCFLSPLGAWSSAYLPIPLLKWLFVGFPLIAASTMLFYRAMSPETSDTVPGLYQHASI